MARTYRAHLSPNEFHRRGGQARKDKTNLKSHKQRRPNVRVKMRREHL